MLTIEKIIELLGPEEYKGKPIDRFELPNIKAVHFLLHDHLDRGYNACSTYDTLGKNCMEYLRAKTVCFPSFSTGSLLACLIFVVLARFVSLHKKHRCEGTSKQGNSR